MKKRGSKRVSLYSNLSNRHKTTRDLKARRKAEYLASLPKHPVKRILYRMHPKRFFGYWFSKEGAFMALKLFGIGLGIIVLLIGMLFLYYRRELDAIKPEELAKRVQTTVTKYYDRNGELLWEDKGDGNYKLVVNSDEISQYMKDATVAIEDKDFYNHKGFSLSGITRAAWTNFTGSGSTQGGSTLTQQLIKQVFFADEAGNRGLSGVPRKIKEVILAIQAESIYNKDQILTMYLNESPYGGRRNGVESAAQTYFGKSAKDLTLAESALLAAIPQNPSYYNPYVASGHEALLARKDTVLDYMVEQGYVKKEEAEVAKKVAILDTIKPEADQYKNIKAPHFVQMVKSDLEKELGVKTVGAGGLTVKTTLDYKAQVIVEEEISKMFTNGVAASSGFDNSAGTMVDVQTGQILALVGSRDFNYPGYGAVNSTTAWIQPGSTIKPLVYAALFKGNYGAGSILSDSPIPQSIYRTDDGRSVNNLDRAFKGNIPIRQSLVLSRNIPAIKAMYLAGRDETLKTIHEMGSPSYCTNGQEVNVGLAASIGGCTTKQIEHVNSFATIARMGVYKPYASVLEVRNSQGQIIKQWKDSSEQALDPQITYQLADILSENIAGQVRISSKTGTSNDAATGSPKDFWFVSITPKVSFGIWAGNHLPSPIRGYSGILKPTNSTILSRVHTEVFQAEGSWKPNDWFAVPAGLTKMTVNGVTDWFPSWYNKEKSTTGEKMAFDIVSKKKATACTPDAAKTEVSVLTMTDPVTKQKTYLTTDGYDPNKEDDVHNCNDTMPFVQGISISKAGGKYKISISVTQGSHALQSISVSVDGQSAGSIQVSSSGTYSLDYSGTNPETVTATVTDTALYTSNPESEDF